MATVDLTGMAPILAALYRSDSPRMALLLRRDSSVKHAAWGHESMRSLVSNGGWPPAADCHQILDLLETSADRVACGEHKPATVLGTVAEIMGIEPRLAAAASLLERRSPVTWSKLPTTEERIASLLETAARIRAHLASLPPEGDPAP